MVSNLQQSLEQFYMKGQLQNSKFFKLEDNSLLNLLIITSFCSCGVVACITTLVYKGCSDYHRLQFNNKMQTQQTCSYQYLSFVYTKPDMKSRIFIREFANHHTSPDSIFEAKCLLDKKIYHV